MSRPGTGLLDSGQGKTAEKSSLCVKPEGGEGTGPADIWEKSLPGWGNSKRKIHEVGVGQVCGKKNREREGKWEEMRSERQ